LGALFESYQFGKIEKCHQLTALALQISSVEQVRFAGSNEILKNHQLSLYPLVTHDLSEVIVYAIHG
jgi:hypothetical protein